jgi:hypothetical protein
MPTSRDRLAFHRSLAVCLPLGARRLVAALSLLACTVIAQAQPAPDPQQIPDESRQGIANALGGPFVVFRDGVLDDLMASDEQSRRLLKSSSGYFPEAMQHFQQMQGMGPEERTKEDPGRPQPVSPQARICDRRGGRTGAHRVDRVYGALRDGPTRFLSDASTLKVPKANIEEIAASNQSNMPDGLLTPFSLQKIADLLAVLESGKPVKDVSIKELK